MNKLLALFTSLLLLTGCLQSSTLTEEDKALPDSDQSSFNRDSVEIDYDRSYLAFTGTKNSFSASHQCEFESYTVSITLDATEPGNLEKAQFAVDIDITSLKTDNDRVTTHLLSPDFFAAETYSTANFVSTAITPAGEAGSFLISGDLSIKETTQEVTFAAQITNDYATMKLTIDRLDFGVGEENYVDNPIPIEAKLIFQS